MDKRLHQLESFSARGSDGTVYKVCGFEHMVRDESIADGQEHWESTGLAEYRLVDGRRVEMRPDGSMHVVGANLDLQRA